MLNTVLKNTSHEKCIHNAFWNYSYKYSEICFICSKPMIWQPAWTWWQWRMLTGLWTRSSMRRRPNSVSRLSGMILKSAFPFQRNYLWNMKCRVQLPPFPFLINEYKSLNLWNQSFKQQYLIIFICDVIMNTGFNLLKINRDKEHFISYMTLTFENEMQFLQNKLFNKKGKKAKNVYVQCNKMALWKSFQN